MTKKSLVIGSSLGAALLLVGVVVCLNLRRTPVGDMATPLSDLHVLGLALTRYYGEHHNYPQTLAALGPPPLGGASSANAAGLIDDKLASGSEHRYRFSYHAFSSSAKGALDRFTINADPTDGCSKNCPHYFMDENCVVHMEANSTATAKSPLMD